MPLEIERKFLVISDGWRSSAEPGQYLRQGYISHAEQGSVRVRHAADKAWLTLKSGRAGILRHEFEYDIPVAHAIEMLDRLCIGPIIEKTRYRVPHGGRLWEVDVFGGDAQGLIVAEVELASVRDEVIIPSWAGKEVTDDPRFRNSAITLVGAPLFAAYSTDSTPDLRDQSG